ncbi:MAG: DUF1854 domain-containing protein [Planctomycetota bacterium]|jgi:hypothetical protein
MAEGEKNKDPAAGPGEPRLPVSGRDVRVRRDDAGVLIVHLAGRNEPITDAHVARCFPWSSPERHISITDSEGKEVAILETLAELDAESRRVVEEELTTRVFNPKIRRIVKVKYEFGVTSITAETDRGEVSFQVRSRDDVRVLSARRALFRDVDGNTYELPDLYALDPVSRKQLEQYF